MSEARCQRIIRMMGHRAPLERGVPTIGKLWKNYHVCDTAAQPTLRCPQTLRVNSKRDAKQ